MKSFWFKNSTFTFCVWVLGQVDHCDENFWIVKYSKICSYFSSVTKWCNFKCFCRIYPYMCAFLQIWRWVLIPILVGNDLPRHDLPYSKGLMKFVCNQPSRKMFDFWNFISSKRRLTQGPALWNFGISDKLYFFFSNVFLQSFCLSEVSSFEKYLDEVMTLWFADKTWINYSY